MDKSRFIGAYYYAHTSNSELLSTLDALFNAHYLRELEQAYQQCEKHMQALPG